MRQRLTEVRDEQTALIRSLIKWVALGAWVGLLSGAASALFLISLEWATSTRETHPFLLYLLPIAGAVIGLSYKWFGAEVEAGNNLLLDTVHNPEGSIPFRMAPMVLISTVVTHLFGGSAGREGTAVQMGGTLANLATTPLKLSRHDHRILIMSGISGGFGSVFGTPVAGAVFGMEVLTVGRMSYEAFVPCLVASVIGDLVCRVLGVKHHVYPTLAYQSSPKFWLAAVVSAVLFAFGAGLFSELTHWIAAVSKKRVPSAWGRPALGGIVLVALTLVAGRDYLGLGLPLISRSFTPLGVPDLAFLAKIVFTAITLGFGFKGGEVTPLFCIGACLGSYIGKLTGQPGPVFAALGFVAVFAGAANTPLSCVIMGVELFGGGLIAPLAVVCLVAYVLSGHRGIYLSQRVHTPKSQYIKVGLNAVLRTTRSSQIDVLSTGLLPRSRSQARQDATPANRKDGEI